MAAGWPLDKNTLDQRAGQVVIAVYQALREAAEFKARLDGLDNAAFQAMGYTDDDRDTVRAAAAAMDTLHSVSHAGALPAGPDDFFFHGKKLTGVFGIRG